MASRQGRITSPAEAGCGDRRWWVAVSSFARAEQVVGLTVAPMLSDEGFGLAPDALAAQGVAVARAADQLQEVARGDPLEKVEAVLPGSATAATAADVATAWTASLAGLVEALDAHAAAFAAAVAGYRGADAALGDGFTASGRR